MSATQWFGTAEGRYYHALSFDASYAVCHRGIVPDAAQPMPEAVSPDGRRRQCSKCLTRLERLAAQAARQSKRLTASQTWERLDPSQREALLGWVLGSYAPSAHAQRFPLLKSETLTRATNVISQHWKGVS